MPRNMHIAEIDLHVGPFKVSGRVDVIGPFFGAHAEGQGDHLLAAKGLSLAERIERAVNAAVVKFSADMLENEPVSKG